MVTVPDYVARIFTLYVLDRGCGGYSPWDGNWDNFERGLHVYESSTNLWRGFNYPRSMTECMAKRAKDAIFFRGLLYVVFRDYCRENFRRQSGEFVLLSYNVGEVETWREVTLPPSTPTAALFDSLSVC